MWAPTADLVELVLEHARHVMRPEDRGPEDEGWWVSDTDVAPGTDYAFSLDRGPARPDPRSAWQPHGVHGPSRAFDAGAFAWSDATWRGLDVRGRVHYELHVGTFTPEGTLAAAAGRLGALAEIGVEVVELLPIAAFDGDRGWGYDGVALWAVHDAYGGPRALQAFVDAAHALGLAVCLDVVHNHLGPSGNYLAEFGPYFTDAHHTPWGAALNLDGPGSDEVRRWICDGALRWFRDFHVDALRLDAVHALVDDSPRHVLAQLSDETAALAATLARPLSLVAESDLNDVVSLTPTAAGGWGMTAQWADDVHHAVHALLTGERHGYYVDFGSPQTLRKALTDVFVHDGEWSTFRGRPWGRPVPPDVDGHRFVVFAANHDQVGNRAVGDRPSATLDAGLQAVEAALVLLSPFTPLLFMGDEWGARTPWQFFTDHRDPQLARAVTEGRRAEFAGHGWSGDGREPDVPDPQDPATFARSTLDWSERDSPDRARMLAWTRRLTRLRGEVPDLGSGDRSSTDLSWGGAVDDAGRPAWLVVRRGSALVVCSLAPSPVDVPLGRAGWTVLASWSGEDAARGERVAMAGRSVAVLAH
ncbi:malto-oligosyltrehalose trehalohydrolase [Cellulomonas alba]|uniref:malto-oligosyltrehalose trehalohydrolase n=1 Tax=Cellulomonas alba TaxID=3053467 RepID=UPI0038994893